MPYSIMNEESDTTIIAAVLIPFSSSKIPIMLFCETNLGPRNFHFSNLDHVTLLTPDRPGSGFAQDWLRLAHLCSPYVPFSVGCAAAC